MRVNHPDAAHPEAGRFDRTHGDEGKTGPVLTGATVAALDDEVDRLTAERDMLREALAKICDATFQIAVNGHLMTDEDRAGEIGKLDIGALYETSRAALAKLEDES